MIRELVTRKIDWREISLLFAIAAATSFITLGVLECLFDNVQCIQVRPDGSQSMTYGVKSCDPSQANELS